MPRLIQEVPGFAKAFQNPHRLPKSKKRMRMPNPRKRRSKRIPERGRKISEKRHNPAPVPKKKK